MLETEVESQTVTRGNRRLLTRKDDLEECSEDIELTTIGKKKAGRGVAEGRVMLPEWGILCCASARLPAGSRKI